MGLCVCVCMFPAEPEVSGMTSFPGFSVFGHLTATDAACRLSWEIDRKQQKGHSCVLFELIIWARSRLLYLHRGNGSSRKLKGREFIV